MRKNSFLRLAILIIGWSILNACSNDELEQTMPNEGQGITTLHATFAKETIGGNTRLGHTYNSGIMNVVWKSGDDFRVYEYYNNADPGVPFTLNTGAESKNATFTGGELPVSDFPSFEAIYPRSITEGKKRKEVEMNLANQTQTGNGTFEHLNNYTFMRAAFSDPTSPIEFTYDTSILRFFVKLDGATADESVKSLKISIENDQPDWQNGFCYKAIIDGGLFYSSSMTLTLEDATLVDGEFVAYLTIFLGSKINDNLTITMETTAGDIYTSAPIPANISYDPGKIYSNNDAIILTKEEAAVPPAIGDYYPLDSDANSAEGIVFWVANDGSSYKVVAKEEGGSFTWGPIMDQTNATDWNDGRSNTDKIIGLGISNYPAFGPCINMQGNWYLPAANEIWDMFNNKNVLNSPIATIGGAAIAGPYWTSTEDGWDNANFFNGEFNMPMPSDKTNPFSVRCIKKVTL